jgi:hypothetical protein
MLLMQALHAWPACATMPRAHEQDELVCVRSRFNSVLS